MGYCMSYIIEFPMAVALTSAQLPSRMHPKEQKRYNSLRIKFPMVSTNASAPLLQVEGEIQLPPTLLETTIVKVGVADTGKNENSVNGGGESGDVDSEVMVRRKRGRPRKHLVESRECLPSLQNLVSKRGRGRPPGTEKLQLLAAMAKVGLLSTQLEQTSLPMF